MYLRPLLARVPGKYRGAGGGRSAAVGMVGVGVVLAVLLSSCATSATYVGSSSQDVFYKLPKNWTVYSQTALQNMGLTNATQTSQAQAEGASYQMFVSFASPNPHLDKHGSPDLGGKSPWAYNYVEALAGSDAESISLGSLTDLLFPVDTLAQQGDAKQLAPTKLLVKGSLRGTRIAYTARSQSGSLSFEQVALINSPTDEVWVLAVGCSTSCFKAHRATINKIIDSFTVTGQGG